jgi:hypothetical protein
VLDARVQVLGVLSDDDEVDVLVARLQTADAARRPQVRVEPKHLAERHVDAAEPLPHWRRDRTLEGDLVALDRVQDVLGQRRSVLGHDGLTRVDDLPVEGDARRVEDASGCLRQLRSDAVAGDQGHTVGHGPIVSAPAGKARPATSWR